MTWKTQIVGGENGVVARVSNFGEMITSPIARSKFYTATVVSNNVPVNLVTPMTGKQFIITTIAINGDRSIGANGAIVQIYENDIGPTDTTITQTIYTDEVAKQTRAILTGLNIAVTAGRWVNVVADDVQVRANIAGYYLNL